MSRAGIVWAAIAVWVCCGGSLAAQTASTEGWVVLSVDDYRALRDRANPPAAPPAAPPVDATLTRIDYELALNDESVAGRALLTIDVLREGWARVPMPPGLMVRAAVLDGQPVSLLEGPPPHVLLSREGRFVLTLDIVVPLAATSGTESFTLPASSSPIAGVTFTLPRGGVDLSVTGGLTAERAESATESRWTVFGRANQPLTLAWKRKVDDRRAEQPLRIRARITQVTGLGEDSCQLVAAVRAEVVQGLAREISLALPPGVIVNEVNGSTVADWNANAGTLRVLLLEPVATEISFIVQAEARAVRDGLVVIPLIRVPAAERETGGVAVDVVGAGEIAGRQPRGMEPADPSELGEMAARSESPSMIAFRFRPQAGTEPRGLTVYIVRYMPQPVLVANVEEARYRTLASEDGLLLVHARYAVRNNQRGFLKVTLPERATVWSAQVAGRPIRPGLAEGDAVLLPLEKGRPGEEAPTFAVEILYVQRIDVWNDNGRARVDLPALDLPVLRTGVELYYPPRFRVEPVGHSFRREEDPGPFAEALRESPSAHAVAKAQAEERGSSALQMLVDRFRDEAGGRIVAGSLPVDLTFPRFGPSMFFASELTAEARALSVEFAYKKRN